MHDFRYVGNKLYCEGVSLETLARKYGTPLFVYSQHTLSEHFRRLDRAMSGVEHLVCFAVKSNSNQSVLPTQKVPPALTQISSVSPTKISRGFTSAPAN